MPNGDLLIVAMRSKRLLRFDSNEISVHADLSELASGFCNDMVVDKIGRAYVETLALTFTTMHREKTPKLFWSNLTVHLAVSTTKCYSPTVQ